MAELKRLVLMRVADLEAADALRAESAPLPPEVLELPPASGGIADKAALGASQLEKCG